MSTADRRFVIVPRRPRTRALTGLLIVAWLGSLWLTFDLTRRYVAPGLAQTEAELAELRERHADAEARLARLNDRATVLKRSDQVSRAANQELQAVIAERDDEIAQLRADVAFYERLVGASGQRQGLAVHSLTMAPASDSEAPTGAFHYTLTLTQNLKKATVSKGQVTLRVDGVRDGKLSTLAWNELRQEQASQPLSFAFKYFQQLEGSLMLPSGFVPHRVWVQVKSDAGSVEQSFPWQDTQTRGA